MIGEAVGTNLIKDGEFSKSDEKIVKLSSSLGTIFTAEALGKDAQTSYNSSNIAVENNTIYLLKNKVVALDKDKNDKVIVLSDKDKEKLLNEDTTTTLVKLSNTINSYLSAGETHEVIPTISKYAQYNVTNSEIYNLNNQEDLNFLIKETDMGYINNDENTRVYFANGMDNTAPQALQTAKNIESLVNQPVGSIVNSTDGIVGDVAEYIQGYSTKDVLNEYTYRKLNNNTPIGEKTTVIMHSAGNPDTAKAIDLGVKQGYSYPNLQFVSAGSPSSEKYLRSIFNSAGSTLVGQVNDWKDPVTHSKTVAIGALGITAATTYFGGTLISPLIETSSSLPLVNFATGLINAGVGASVGASVGGGSILGGVKLYHPMDKYLEKPELQDMIKNSVLKEK